MECRVRFDPFDFFLLNFMFLFLCGFLGSIRISVEVVWYLRTDGQGVLISDLVAKFRMEVEFVL